MLTTEQILKSARLSAQCGEADCRRDSLIPRRSPSKPKRRKGEKVVTVRLAFEEDPQTGEMRTVRGGSVVKG